MKSSMFAGAAAALITMVNALTEATGALAGNPIYLPNLDSPVTVGKPYTITWDPSTEGTVSLVLLKGPSENIIPQYPIVENIPNSGTYTWTPAADLVGQPTGYGIQLIVDATGDYQYTTQFGVINEAPAAADPAPVVPEASVPAGGAYDAYPTEAPVAPAPVEPGYEISYSTEYETKTDCDCTETPVPTAPAPVTPPVGTGVPAVPYPGGNDTTPVVPAVPTGTGVPVVPVPTQVGYTGAAGQIKAGGFMMAIVAIVAVAMF